MCARELQSVLILHTKVNDFYGTTGLVLADNWILTHGSLLAPDFSTSKSDISDFLFNARKRLDKDLIGVPTDVAATLEFSARFKLDVASDQQHQDRYTEKRCRLKAVWRCSLLRKTFEDRFFSWSFEKSDKYDKSLMPIFLLLRIDDDASSASGVNEAKAALTKFYNKHLSNLPELRRGVGLEIESVPFSNIVFLNSLSRGIVSNVIGERDCVVLTDANAVPGCQGAPVFRLDTGKDRQISGLVIATLCWCRGEWVDYTFAVNLKTCVDNILRQNSGKLTIQNSIDAVQKSALLLPDAVDRSLVVVKCGSGWGTGVVVDATTGTVLTCSHVVREAPGTRIKVALATTEKSNDSDEETWARLIYRTREDRPYDIAVLRLESRQQKFPLVKALEMASILPVQGTPVLTIGFPFFASSAPASCSQGIISRVSPSMLQTTCCVQSGVSGGPIVNLATRELVGLIVSNGVSDNSPGALLYPRFNMAVPAVVFNKPVMDYVKSGNVKCLESLSSGDPTVNDVWNFYLTPRSKM